MMKQETLQGVVRASCGLDLGEKMLETKEIEKLMGVEVFFFLRSAFATRSAMKL